MNLQHLKYFVELAHTENYTVAARHLHITQPSLSYAIGQLEEELGVPLFTRSGRNSVMTSYGRKFLTYAEGALRTLNQGMEAVYDITHQETVIQIGFLRFLGVHYIPNLIKGFQQAHPEYSVRFELENDLTNRLIDGLNTSRYDVVFCAPSRRLQKNGTKIGHQRLYLVVPEKHPLAEREAVTLEETFSYPWIYYKEGASTRSIIEHSTEDIYSKLDIRYEIMEERVVAGFIAAGFGIGILPNMALLETLPVTAVEISEPVIGRDIFMLTTSTREISPALEAFIRYVKHHPWDEVM